MSAPSETLLTLFLKPGTSLMRRLHLPAKMVLMGLVLTLPLTWLTVQSLRDRHQRLEDTRSEVHGAGWAPLAGELRRLVSGEHPRDARAAFRLHSELVEAQRRLLLQCADRSPLLLEPESTRFHLMHLAVEQIVPRSEALGRMRCAAASTPAARRSSRWCRTSAATRRWWRRPASGCRRTAARCPSAPRRRPRARSRRPASVHEPTTVVDATARVAQDADTLARGSAAAPSRAAGRSVPRWPR